jgi:hypothetical protein
MKGLRIVVTIAIVLLWGLFVPVAMAVDHCAAMGGMCEGPCGASSTVTAPSLLAFAYIVSRAASPASPAAPQPEQPTLELPPKSPVLPA